MSTYFLSAFLIIFGLSMLIALAIPNWVVGILALVAGVLILIGR